MNIKSNCMLRITILGLVVIFGSALLIGCSLGKEKILDKTNKTGEQNFGGEQDKSGLEINKDEENEYGFVHLSKSQAMFIRWTETAGKIVGQLIITQLSDKEVKSKNQTFEGVRDKSSISITFSGGLLDSLTGVTWTGTLKGDEVTFVYPTKDGTLGTIILKSGSVAEFNETVSSFQETADEQTLREEEAKAYQQRQEQEAKYRQKAASTLNYNFNYLVKQTSGLANYNFTDISEDYQSTWTNMQGTYYTLKEIASKKPLTEDDLYTLESYIYSLEEYLYSFENINYSMHSTESDCRDSVSEIKKGISYVQKSWEDYLNAGSPGGQYRGSNITKAIQEAEKQIKSSNSSMQKARNDANTYNSKANQLYQAAKSLVEGLKSAK